jgi:hypothetical protein
MGAPVRRGSSAQPTGRLKIWQGSPFASRAFVYPLGAVAPAMGNAAALMPQVVGTRKTGSVGPYVSLSAEPGDMIKLGADSRMQAESFSVMMVMKVDALPSSGLVITLFESGSGVDNSFATSNESFQFRAGSSGEIGCVKDNVVEIVNSPVGAISAGKWAAVSVSHIAGSTGRGRTTIAVDGRIVYDAGSNVSGLKAGNFTIGSKDGTRSEKGAIDVALFTYWPTALTANELADVSAKPWQLFEAPPLPVFNTTAVIAPVTLNGAATAVASAYGTLTSAIALAGAAQAIAIGAGSLSTSFPLSGKAVVRASAAGALSTAIPLAGAAQARAAAAGTLAGGGAARARAAQLSASAAGSLSTAIPLAGTARVEASASGTLAGTATGLIGAARATASATGALSTSIRLAGAAAAVASAYGVLGTKIMLGGSAVASATATGALSLGKPSTPIDISKVSPSRIVPFDGSGSRIVVFQGSGKRMRFNEMSAKKPQLVNGKWMTDRDPDEKSYYAADITDELSDRYTTLAAGGDAIELILQGVTQLEALSVQVANVDGVDRTYIVVLLGGVEGDLPKDWLWCARVKCANGERFDKTTWFNRVDT